MITVVIKALTLFLARLDMNCQLLESVNRSRNPHGLGTAPKSAHRLYTKKDIEFVVSQLIYVVCVT